MKTSDNASHFTGALAWAACLLFATGASGQGLEAEFPMELTQPISEEPLEPVPPYILISYDEALDADTYFVGPGDLLEIFVGRNHIVKVNPESYVLFPGVAPIMVKGLTLTEAKKKIVEALSRRFDRSLIHVSLRNVKIVRVPLLGEVEKPGVQSVPGNTRMSEIIRNAGGFSKAAQTPILNVFHADGSRTQVNLSDYYRTGNTRSNPYPRAGDRIVVARIDLSKPHAEFVAGAVSILYQLSGDATLGEILPEVAGILKTSSPVKEEPITLERAKLNRPFDTRAARVNAKHMLTGDALSRYVPQNGDVIELLPHNFIVFVEGAVDRPSIYEYQAGKSPRDYIAEAGLRLEGKHYGNVKVVRVDGTSESISLSNGQVLPGDHLYVPRNAYTSFKDLVITAGSMATVILTVLYLKAAL